MTVTTGKLSRAELLAALEAVDTRAAGDTLNRSIGGDGSSAEEIYTDLPAPVLDIFHEDVRQFDAIFAVNLEKTKESIQQYRDKKITKERFQDLLKTKDDASVQAVDARLAQSRDELATELAKWPSQVQQEALHARSAEQAGMQDSLSTVSEQTEWDTMTAAEADTWLRGVLKNYDDYMKRLFG